MVTNNITQGGRAWTLGAAAGLALAAFAAAAFLLSPAAAQSTQIVFKVAADHDVRIVGNQKDNYGSSVTIGDVNADGNADLVVGATEALGAKFRTGGAYVHFGPLDESVTSSSDAQVRFEGVDFDAGIGDAVVVADLNADGAPDILVSSAGLKVDDNRHGSGVIFAALGPISPTGATAANIGERADFRFLGPMRNFKSGKGLATGDLNNDGAVDVAIGSPGGHELQRGGVDIIFGPFEGSDVDLVDPDNVDVTIIGSDKTIAKSYGTGAGTGASIAIGDVNADGIDDLVVNSRSADIGSIENAGETHIVFGPIDASRLSSESGEDGRIEIGEIADISLQGSDVRDSASESSLAIGDLDGDGVNELIVGAMSADASGSRAAGKVLVFKGPLRSGEYDLLSTADIVIEGEKSVDSLGSGVAVGDLNGDGIPDLAMGASLGEIDEESEDAGVTYVMFGDIFSREPMSATSALPQVGLIVGIIAVIILIVAAGVWYMRRQAQRAMPA